MRTPRTLLLVGILGLVVQGCSTDDASIAEMHALATPYTAGFARYDRWVRRIALADASFASQEALREAVFAPLRESTVIHAAWIERIGPDGYAIRYPRDSVTFPSSGWVRVRLSGVGEVWVQRHRLANVADSGTLVLIRRAQPTVSGATLWVTMAFRSERTTMSEREAD